MPQKICSRQACPIEGPQDSSEYYKDKRSTDGLESRCKTCIRAKTIKRQREHPEATRAAHNRWRDERGGKERMNEYQNEWRAKRRVEDPAYRLRANVSTYVGQILKLRGKVKGGKTFESLPYTPTELIEYLEKKFDKGMTWENYGSYWEVDHIVPCAALPYDSLSHPNFQKCWALSNLQPLPALENRSKGSLHEGVRHTY